MHDTTKLPDHYALVSPQDFSDRMNEYWTRPRSDGGLDVVFQEVVHLVRTEEAEVAKLQCSKERPDEHP